jgi:hypothetical protein
MKLATHSHLVAKLRICGAIPQLSRYYEPQLNKSNIFRLLKYLIWMLMTSASKTFIFGAYTKNYHRMSISYMGIPGDEVSSSSNNVLCVWWAN